MRYSFSMHKHSRIACYCSFSFDCTKFVLYIMEMDFAYSRYDGQECCCNRQWE